MAWTDSNKQAFELEFKHGVTKNGDKEVIIRPGGKVSVIMTRETMREFANGLLNTLDELTVLELGDVEDVQ